MNPKSVGLYLHIPFCRSKCDYCDFYSLAGCDHRMEDYQKALSAHIAETAPLAVDCGASALVAGSAIFGKSDRAAALTELRMASDVKA